MTSKSRGLLCRRRRVAARNRGARRNDLGPQSKQLGELVLHTFARALDILLDRLASTLSLRSVRELGLPGTESPPGTPSTSFEQLLIPSWLQRVNDSFRIRAFIQGQKFIDRKVVAPWMRLRDYPAATTSLRDALRG